MQKKINKSIIAFLIFFLIKITQQLALTPTSNTVNPSYAKSTSSQYTFTFNSAQTAIQTYNINIFFDNTLYALTSVSSCSVTIDTTVLTTALCAVNASTNAIVFTNLNINKAFSTITINFNTITGRYAASPTCQFGFYNTTTSALINSYYVTVTVTNAIMSCQLLSSSEVIGASTTYTINYQPSVQIQTNSMVQIQLDPWGPYNASNFNPSNSTNVCNSQCTISAPQNNGNISETIRYSSLYSSGSSFSNQTLTLLKARNPFSSKPLSVTITVLAIVSAFQSSSYMTCATTFNVNTPNGFSSLSFSPSNSSISASNIISMFLSPTNPLSSSCYLRIIPSIDMTLSYTYNAYNQGTVPSLISGVINQLLIGNIVRSTASSSPTLLILSNFTLTNPPYAVKTASLLFRTQFYYNSTYYTIDQQTIQISSTASTMTSYNISVSNTSIGATTQYLIWFQTINKLISGSFIQIILPSTLSLTLNQTLCSISITGTCSFINTTAINISLTASLNPLTNVSLTLNNMKNPSTTTPTNSITVTTYYSDITSIVDQITSGLTITCTSIILTSSTVSSNNPVVAAKASYNFTMRSTLTTLQNSIINLTFPSTFSESTYQLTSFSINGVAVTGCTISVSGLTVLFNSSCMSQNASNTSIIQFIISNITNPTSTKPSPSFLISTYYNNYLMEYLYNGITITMTTPVNLSYFQVSPSDSSANAQNVYTFDMNFMLTHYSGDRIIITLPSSVTLSGIFSCLSLTTNVTLNCSQTSSSIIQFVISYTSLVYPNSLKFTLSNLTNNWYAGTVSFGLQTTSNDTTFYYMEQSTGVVNYQAANMIATVNNDNNIVLMGISQLTFTLTSPFTLNRATNTSMLYITFGVPTDFTPINSTCILSYPSSVCNNPSTQIFNLTNINDFSTTLTIKFNSTTTYFTQSSNFDIKLYYGSFVVLSNTALKVSSFCVNPCKQCTTTPTQCLSCLPSPQTQNTTYFFANSSCVSVCPSQYFLISTNNTCGTCNASACFNCQNASNTCISCISGKYLFENSCLSVCPSEYYSFNGQCIECSPPCFTCNSSSICLSCDPGFYLDIGTNSTKCVVSCTNTSYVGINGTCKLCTANCLTCSIATNNCTSCNTTNYQYFQNSCIRLCPSGMYSNASGTCANCVVPCATCSSLTQCQSCTSTYYFYNDSVCTQNCPNGYLGVVDTCVKCNSTCATCSVTLSNCTSCPTGKYFYQNECVGICPPLTYPYNKTCTTCIDPCVTCTSSPNYCLTCVPGLLLLDSSCVNQCPNTGYYQNGQSCVSCPSNCITCQSAVQCSICSDGYYNLNGGCTQSCPINYPILVGNNCTACGTQCITCAVSKDNCTQCRIGYYKYMYTCVQTCPFGFFSNAATFTCQNGLTSRIVFFPILIILIIIVSIICISKALVSTTSISTSLSSLLAVCQIAIWIYMIAELSDPMKQVDVNYILPIILVSVTFVSLLVSNILFYYFNSRRVQSDQYARIWLQNNVVYIVYHIVKYTALALSHKLFRISYSKIFSLYTLSMPFKKSENVFPLATIFTLISLVLCQIPMIIGSFSLAYSKIQKDQMFYTSIQCLIVTLTCAIISLIDIYKPEDYFQDNQFVKTKKYLQKVKDSSFNQLQDGFYLQKDQGSVQGEKFVGLTGGKFTFSKQDPSTLNNLYFEQSSSIITDADNSANIKKNKQKKINIFDPIKQEEEQYYEELMYKQEQIKTLARIQQQKKMSANVHNESDQAHDYEQEKMQRGQKLGVKIDEIWDDNKSMIEERPLKQKWNNILTHRQKLSRQIFNTLDQFSTKELQKIQQPKNIKQEQEDQSESNYNNNDNDNEQYSSLNKRRRKRRMKKGHNNQPGNSQLQKIYLQRLTQKKKHKDIFASSQSIKYDF